MIDTLHGVHPPPGAGLDRRVVPGPRSCLGHDLRDLAEDLIGQVDRDELRADEAAELARVLDEVVLASLPQVAGLVAAELGPRIESLPLHARLALANARERRRLGSE
jgi:hypothetical protein